MIPIFRILLIATVCLTTIGAPAQTLVLTQAVQVLNISIAQAQSKLPVHFRGVIVSGQELESGTAVIHDGSNSVFIRTSIPSVRNLFARTNELEISGETAPGQFSPIVLVKEATLLGQGKIPPPRPVAYEDLLMGGLDSQWVEINGLLRFCAYLTKVYPRLEPGMEGEIATGGGRLLITTLGRGINPDWVDGSLHIRGICLHRFNQKHQFFQVFLVIPEGEQIKLQKPPPVANPFDLPAQDIGSLLQFSQTDFGHRVRVQGVVTYRKPGEFLYLNDQSRSLFVRTHAEDLPVSVGDEVSVVGFPAQGDYSPIIEDAVYKVLAHGRNLPDAVVLQKLSEAFEHDAEIITGRAKLLGLLQQENGWVLSLQMDNSVFTAFLQKSSTDKDAPKLEAGSEIEYTGICAVVMGQLDPRNPMQSPQSFRVLLRSGQDLHLIMPPPWWTPLRILIASTIVVLTLTAGIAIVILVFRTRFHRQQAARRQAEAEFAAILNERNRLAREIHDTLAQDLAAVSAQLEIIRAELPTGANKAESQIQRARTIVRNSLAEARRSIFNMRSQVLETGDLQAALRDLLNQETQGRDIQAQMNVSGHARRLASAIENDLLRIGQEAIHNAVRHGQPKNLEVELHFNAKSVLLRVRDDGCGYTTANIASVKDSHFGVSGMNERARRLGTALTVNTAPGKGTEIAIEIQLG